MRSSSTFPLSAKEAQEFLYYIGYDSLAGNMVLVTDSDLQVILTRKFDCLVYHCIAS